MDDVVDAFIRFVGFDHIVTDKFKIIIIDHLLFIACDEIVETICADGLVKAKVPMLVEVMQEENHVFTQESPRACNQKSLSVEFISYITKRLRQTPYVFSDDIRF